MHFKILLAFILSAIFCMSIPVYSQSKTYTNKDIEILKKTSNKAAPAKSVPKKTETVAQPKKIKGLTIEKKAVTKSEPVVKYESKDGNMNLTVRGSAKPIDKAKLPVADNGLPYSLRVRESMLPYKDWQEEYEEYFDVHYKDPEIELKNPALIAIRSLKAPTFGDVFSLYKRGSLYDEGDDGLMYNHLSSHFVIDSNGMIFQTMPLAMKTKGAAGVEHKAITIELTGITVQDFNVNSVQKKALKELLAVLITKFNISTSKIYSVQEIAKGKQMVAEYMDDGDSDYPDRYSPRKSSFGPSITYMTEIRTDLQKELQMRKLPTKGKKAGK